MPQLTDLPPAVNDAVARLVLEALRPYAEQDGEITIGEFADRLRPLIREVVQEIVREELEREHSAGEGGEDG